MCVIGSVRGGPSAWDSLFAHVLDPLRADLAILGKQTSPEQKMLFQRARYVWNDVPEHNNWAEMLDAFAGPPYKWRKYAAKSTKSGLWGPVQLKGKNDGRELPGSGAIIFLLRMYLLERLEPIRHLYNQIMLTRSDHYYVCLHPRLSRAQVWVPEGEDYPPNRTQHSFRNSDCITDRHVLFPPSLMTQVLGILPWLLHAKQLHSASRPRENWPNPECALGAYWRASGISGRVSRFQRVMFTVTRPTIDGTRWAPKGLRKLTNASELGKGYSTKYHSERERARKCVLSSTSSVAHKNTAHARHVVKVALAARSRTPTHATHGRRPRSVVGGL